MPIQISIVIQQSTRPCSDTILKHAQTLLLATETPELKISVTVAPGPTQVSSNLEDRLHSILKKATRDDVDWCSYVIPDMVEGAGIVGVRNKRGSEWLAVQCHYGNHWPLELAKAHQVVALERKMGEMPVSQEEMIVAQEIAELVSRCIYAALDDQRTKK